MMPRALRLPTLWFTRHEAWALRMAMKAPILAPFSFGTLCIWLFPPALLLGAPGIFAMETGTAIGTVISAALGVPAFAALVFIAPWLFHWFFTCFTLMAARPRMAQTKAKALATRLEALQG